MQKLWDWGSRNYPTSGNMSIGYSFMLLSTIFRQFPIHIIEKIIIIFLTNFSLKLGNLFLSDEMQMKLGDFGLAAKLEFDNEKRHTVCGTPNYIAPEILENKAAGHSYEVDIWSLGVVM